MKTNGNNKNKGNYYIGLDVGTNSVGWAVSDQDYNILKFHGKDMWGARLFDEAQDASARRAARTNRRRLNRRNRRIHLLELLFAEEMAKKDNAFFIRLHESSLLPEDKSEGASVYSLFADVDYTDKDYAKKYPTIYHLRSDLIHNAQPHDIRLVYLALHHLIKYRGHFLYESSGDGNGKTLEQSIQDYTAALSDYDIQFEPANPEEFRNVLMNEQTLTEKKKALRAAYGELKTESEEIDLGNLLDLLTGATVQLAKLFNDDDLKNAEISKVSLADELDSKLDALGEALEEKLDIIVAAKQVFDVARLGKILGSADFICDAKIALYNRNHDDIQLLKKYVKENLPEEYKAIFDEAPGIKNFAAYMRYKTDEKCTQEEFCSFLKAKLKGMEKSEDEQIAGIWKEINDKTFLTKLKGSDNGLIPYQLELKELNAILNNAEKYLPFLSEKDETGLTVSDKIRSIFTFRIPYFVGPLNRKAKHSWIVRSDEPIYPWNFKDVVDEKASAHAFMENLIGRCTYTGEPVLPLNSLLYSEFMVLNEINNIKVNGQPITVDAKKLIYDELFVNSKKKVRKKNIYNLLLQNGLITKDDEITGVDDEIKANLKSLHDFRQILDRTKDKAQVEKIIRSILVFSDNPKMLETWLRENTHDLTESDIRYILRLKYKEWGRLSAEFLTKVYTPDENGEAVSIIEMLRNTNANLMQLLSDEYDFSKNAQLYRLEHNPISETIRDRLEELYIAPAVRRSIWQTLRIVDEVVDIEKAAPAKIFIEMARGSKEEMKKKRTESRKNQLLALYQSCKKQSEELYDKLQGETDQTLRRDKLYLYYLQMGRCMYSGEPIDLDKLLKDNETYDIDHIFPRSKIKDNSLNNRVLVKSVLNRDKTNIYPISEDIRNRMRDFWSMLHQKGLISDIKYARLTRNYPLTDEELSSFVARQLVSTQQSTKALADMLGMVYPNSRIVYSKAGNVSDFRQEFDFIKCRDINDLHHAKDAYLNIVVGNTYNTKFTDQFFRNIHAENYSLNMVFKFSTPGAWKADGTSIKTVKKYMRKNSPIVTFMPVEYKGIISDLQLMPKGKGQLPIKTGLSVDNYGGYNKLKGSYFCVVEHGPEKKRIRTIEPVYLYAKALYDTDPIEYCKKILKRDNPIIICPKILVNSVIEIDGSKLAITGRTENRILYKHTYQFSVDETHAKYIKELGKYIDRCEASNTLFETNEYVSKEENKSLYEWIIQRMQSNVYSSLTPISNVISDLLSCSERFENMNMLEQGKTIMEILKCFQCNSMWTNLSALNGKKSVGVLKFSSIISKNQTAYLIHQSVTGLYEVKEDLLK